MLTDKENKKPLKLLEEIEAFITFRMLADKPFFEAACMQGIKDDIVKCLEANKGIDTNE